MKQSLDRKPFMLSSSAGEHAPQTGSFEAHPPPRRVALIGTFAPRQCGIATFTADIHRHVKRYHPEITFDVYAPDDAARPASYDASVFPFNDCDPEAYRTAAEAINRSGADAVWLQHEYGIFGGERGELVLNLIERVAAPLVVTFHTVLSEPDEKQRRIIERLIERASRIMVMSRHSRDLLTGNHGAPDGLIEIIEHGAPDRPFEGTRRFKEMLGLSTGPVLTTFGLLGPGKGLEHVIEALPLIRARHPDVLYRILGATHPNLVAREGEAYRERLGRLAQKLGVDDAIAWDNRFLENEELLDQLQACDIYLTPYCNLQQSTSGTLSYAVAMGSAVVSTPFVHARELLADGAGKLIEPGSPAAIANAVNDLLDDPDALHAMQRRAYERGRKTTWPQFAAASAALIQSASADGQPPVGLASPPDLQGVLAISDGTGVLQHGNGIVPDRRHGYCLDDNARALLLCAGPQKQAEARNLALTCASFLQDAWNDELGKFRNFQNYDRSWCEERGSDDSNGRALWALGIVAVDAIDPLLREWATRWYDRTLCAMEDIDSPRACAFAILGACATLRERPGHDRSRNYIEEKGAFLHRLLDRARRPDWAWFEAMLGYDNPRLPQALMEAADVLDRPQWREAALESMGWIAQHQIAASGHFRPVGSDTFGYAYEHLPFDQQPLEAQAAIEAALSAFRIDGDPKWLDHAEAAWAWFFGENDRGVVMADPTTGRCHDGINPRGINANCGAESILAFQLGYYAMVKLRTAADRQPRGSKLETAGRPSEFIAANS